jgi:acyl-CoA thioesterase
MGGMWEIRQIIDGGWNTFGKRRLWMREIRPLIDDEPMSGFVRLALAADFASPFANFSDEGLGYINSDATLYIHRPLAGEWIGFEVMNHQAREGVAVGECWLYDVEGPLGLAAVCAITQKRR